MTRSCSFEKKVYTELSIESLLSQTVTGETRFLDIVLP